MFHSLSHLLATWTSPIPTAASRCLSGPQPLVRVTRPHPPMRAIRPLLPTHLERSPIWTCRPRARGFWPSASSAMPRTSVSPRSATRATFSHTVCPCQRSFHGMGRRTGRSHGSPVPGFPASTSPWATSSHERRRPPWKGSSSGRFAPTRRREDDAESGPKVLTPRLHQGSRQLLHALTTASATEC